MKTLITLATYDQARTADFIKEVFEKAEIDCFFAFTYDYEKKTEKVSVQVKEEDVERAVKIMLGIRDEYGKNIEEIEPAGRLKKIVVPTDFSKGSEKACYYAVHLAKKLNAEIKILHVYENPMADVNIKKSATFENYAEYIIREIEGKAKNDIVDFVQKVDEYMDTRQLKGVNVHSSIVMGDVVTRIKEVCKHYSPDFIVLGTVGRREGSTSVFAGAVRELILGLQIPLFAIPGPFDEKCFDKLNILYATDFNEKDNTSLNQLLKILESFDKSITCIHIDTGQNTSKKERMEELNALLKRDYREHQVSCRLIEHEDVYYGMKEFAGMNKISLLSFTTQKRSIFEKLFKPDLFKKILQESNLPILIFPS
jgi:nucleotide-binding universal stress UspA family protein